MEYCWSYNADCGYDLKDRCMNDYIMYNRLGDEQGLAMGNTENGFAVRRPTAAPLSIFPAPA